MIAIGAPKATSKAIRIAADSPGQALYGPGVDIWGLGCLTYELLYGSSLFGGSGRSEAEVSAAVLSGEPAVLPQWSPAGNFVSAEAMAFVWVRSA